jgi:hypothetical protein
VISSSDNENVSETGTERTSLDILDGCNGKGSLVLLDVLELSNTSSIVTLGDVYHSSNLELEDVAHLSGSDINLDRVVGLNIGIGETKSTSIVGDSNGNLVGSDVSLGDLDKLVRSLLLGNTVKNITSLGVEKKTEDISGLLKLDNVHESSGEMLVGADLSVNLYASLEADLLTLLSGECVLELITEDDSEGKTLALLVRTSSCLGCPDTSHLVEPPMLGCIDALKVLLESVRPVWKVKWWGIVSKVFGGLWTN